MTRDEWKSDVEDFNDALTSMQKELQDVYQDTTLTVE